MSTASEGLLTVEQFMALPDQPGKQEFDRGRVIEMPPPKSTHTRTAKKIYDRLTRLLEGTEFAVVSEAGFLIARDIVRQPDVAVLEQARLDTANDNEYFTGAPLVAVEVASPGNTAEQLDLKIDQYLRNGSQSVWVAYPRRQAIVRFALTAGRIHSVEYRTGETLSESFGTVRWEFDPGEAF